ncbi:hypothetical protein BD626DRAFT_508788 [Schizophyllum amplum]|uniref:Ribosome production factor 2 homolog n=1 Tax=Schizophyllum amplum TaxID=97359 RepID=A0A550C393_9AGAR|nr:hypothetical protein BD626DRAFT_508788 [Auriculariopsis ampla]
MLRTVKPKNARSKRALEARAPKQQEDARTAVFVKGTHTGDVLNNAMKDLMALKRPDSISFSKKNVVHPFEAQGAQSLEFWAQKNDASVFVSPKSTPGHKPLMHFASELFDTHPRFVQLKSMLMDFFNGEEIDSICLKGLEHVISVSCGPTPAGLNTTASADPSTSSSSAVPEPLPKVHLRVYTTRLLNSGTRVPRVELVPMGPSLDLSLRRHTPPDAELMKQALKRPKLRQQDVAKGQGKKRKNMEVDEMGDLRGRLHVGKQDLEKLQTRKMKGLKEGREEKRQKTE